MPVAEKKTNVSENQPECFINKKLKTFTSPRGALTQVKLAGKRHSQIVQCECGVKLSRGGLTRHKKTWKHYKLLEQRRIRGYQTECF